MAETVRKDTPILAGCLFGGRCGNYFFGVRAAGGFVAGGIEVGVERVEDHHREFVAEAV
jgi:hypothetical protein